METNAKSLGLRLGGTAEDYAYNANLFYRKKEFQRAAALFQSACANLDMASCGETPNLMALEYLGMLHKCAVSAS